MLQIILCYYVYKIGYYFIKIITLGFLYLTVTKKHKIQNEYKRGRWS